MPKAKPSRRKPKFKVGRVVATREPNPSFFKIKRIFYDRFENICYDLHTMAEWSEGELRSLTAREKGLKMKNLYSVTFAVKPTGEPIDVKAITQLAVTHAYDNEFGECRCGFKSSYPANTWADHFGVELSKMLGAPTAAPEFTTEQDVQEITRLAGLPWKDRIAGLTKLYKRVRVAAPTAAAGSAPPENPLASYGIVWVDIDGSEHSWPCESHKGLRIHPDRPRCGVPIHSDESGAGSPPRRAGR